MSLPTQSKRFILTNPPTNLPQLDGPSPTFTLETSPLPTTLQDDQILLKTLYISNDPAQRSWISANQDPQRLYVPPVERGQTMRSRNVMEVVESKSDKYKKGDHLLGTLGWVDYTVQEAAKVEGKKVPQQNNNGHRMSETHYLGAFGMTGFTAYYGLVEIARAGPGDTVVVSGAAGATGSMVVQIAKRMLGCKRVIGMAGEERKCRWVESLGADVCLNYKEGNFKERLIQETDGYVEVFFDNVGGEILDLMLTRVKRFGRIAACGAIAQYNKGGGGVGRDGLKNWAEIISNRIEIRGFIVLDFYAQKEKVQRANEEMVKAYQEGKIQLGDQNETVVEVVFEDVPKTWMGLFEGTNTGKLITKLIDEPRLKGSL